MDIAHVKAFGVALGDFGSVRDPARAEGPGRGQRRSDAPRQQRRAALVAG